MKMGHLFLQGVLMKLSKEQKSTRTVRGTRGFTMVEMIVAVSMMLVLGSTVFSLFDKHAKIFKLQQEVTEMNIGLRSALDMISADLLNAGANLSVGGSAAFPFPVIVAKNANGNFDSITIFEGDFAFPPTSLTNMGGVNNGGQTANSSTLFIDPCPGLTSKQTAALLPAGSFVIVVNTDRNDPNFGQIAPITLTQDSDVNAGEVRVKLNHNPTGDLDSNFFFKTLPQNKLGVAFPPGSLVAKLAPPIQYSISTANPTRPVLVRSTISSLSIVSLPLTSNILGFSQRVRLSNGQIYDTPASYQGIDVNGDTVAAPNDFSLIRSVEVTAAGRTDSDRIDAYRSAIDTARTFRLNSLSTMVALRNKVNY